ncbi:MAG TPA: GNAT family N-acetyltransferase [Thiolinea sp.]|nr:GNAT family N-acetyltransferase [Thiolinea sp.]
MSFQIRAVDTLNQQQINELSQVLIACVEAGASVGFMLPLSAAKAAAYWQDVNTSLQQGERLVFIAESDLGEIIGSVQIVLAQPENQPHRGDLSKMLVHPKARRQGLAASLLTAAEAGAKAHGKTLIVLDTANPEAERVYERGDWQRCGLIPEYALWPAGGCCATTFFYKKL